MNYVKLNNFRINGQPDYKGLDINLIIPGSQLYPNDTFAVVGYEGDIPEHTDLEIVTQEYYDSIVKLIKENTPESIVDTLKKSNEQLQQDIGSLLLESANDKAKIAALEATTGDLLMEVANLKLGGNA